MISNIKKNSVQCLICGDIIESTHRHDFVSCSCGNVAVDGGLDYLRRVYRDLDKIKDLSVYTDLDDKKENLIKSIKIKEIVTIRRGES